MVQFCIDRVDGDVATTGSLPLFLPFWLIFEEEAHGFRNRG